MNTGVIVSLLIAIFFLITTAWESKSTMNKVFGFGLALAILVYLGVRLNL